jgi:hypothetical protein
VGFSPGSFPPLDAGPETGPLLGPPGRTASVALNAPVESPPELLGKSGLRRSAPGAPPKAAGCRPTGQAQRRSYRQEGPANAIPRVGGPAHSGGRDRPRLDGSGVLFRSVSSMIPPLAFSTPALRASAARSGAAEPRSPPGDGRVRSTPARALAPRGFVSRRQPARSAAAGPACPAGVVVLVDPEFLSRHAEHAWRHLPRPRPRFQVIISMAIRSNDRRNSERTGTRGRRVGGEGARRFLGSLLARGRFLPGVALFGPLCVRRLGVGRSRPGPDALRHGLGWNCELRIRSAPSSIRNAPGPPGGRPSPLST